MHATPRARAACADAQTDAATLHCAAAREARTTRLSEGQARAALLGAHGAAATRWRERDAECSAVARGPARGTTYPADTQKRWLPHRLFTFPQSCRPTPALRPSPGNACLHLSMQATLEALDAACMQCVCSTLEARDVAALQCVSRTLRTLAAADDIWLVLCRGDWELAEARTPAGDAARSFSLAYASWHGEYGRYPNFLRASRALRAIREWTAQHIPPVAASLLPGATEAEIDEFAESLALPCMHPAVRVVLRLCKGQNLLYDERMAEHGAHPFHESALHGILPAYAVYDHLVSTRFLTLKAAARHTAKCREVHILPATGSPCILFAASFQLGKLFFVNAETADVYVGLRTRGLHRACPALEDGLLCWLETYAQELSAGQYAVDELEQGEPNTRAIRAFPRLPPLCSTAVTCGVRVEASATWMPEHSDDAVDAFVYSISFSLLSLEEQQAAGFAPLRSCQLLGRHWVISDASGRSEEVRGPGVIGEHPLLVPGGPPFRYQSQTPVRRTAAGRGGTMLGAFTFVPGTLAARGGPEFAAACGLFPLAVPDWVY